MANFPRPAGRRRLAAHLFGVGVRACAKLSALVLALALTALVQPAHAQESAAFEWQRTGIPVEGGGTLPFFGGIDQAPRFRLADLDRDGDPDLYVLDRDGRVAFYRNDGGALSPRFVPVDDDFLGFPILNWFLFADLDGDGSLDILAQPVESGVSIGYFRNAGGAAPARFERTAAPFLDAAQGAVTFGNTPAFVDLDADGDLDLFYIEPSLGVDAFHENIGTATEPSFGPQQLGYAGVNTYISDTEPSDSQARPRPQPRPVMASGPAERHGLSIPAFFDVDDDQDLDLFVGDLYNTNLWYFRNDGRPDSAAYGVGTREALAFPFEDVYVSTVWPEAADLNGDGITDLLVAPNDEGASLERNVYLYENQNPGGPASFAYRTDSLLTGIDLGKTSRPALGDLDGDGDKDLILSRSTRPGVPGGVQGLVYFENVGTAASPAFRRASDEDPLAAIVLEALDTPTPALADMDGDGDLDLLVGQGSDIRQVFYFENQGTREQHDFVFTGVLLDGGDIRRRPDFLAAPTVGDLDRDGDLDLLVGEYGSSFRAKLFYYRNLGTFEEAPQGRRPLFEFVTARADTAFGFDTLADSVTQYLVPLLLDSDCDGYLDLWIGSADGRLREYRNRGANDSLRFDLATMAFEGIDVGRASAPAFADIDDDGDLDLFIGEENGGVNFFRNRSGELVLEAQDSTVALRWRAVSSTGGVLDVRRSEEGGAFKAIASVPASEGPDFFLRDADSIFAGNRYDYVIEASGVEFVCAAFGPAGVSVPLPAIEVIESSLLPEAGGARIRWVVSRSFRGLSFRLSRQEGQQFVAVPGADAIPGAATSEFFDPEGGPGSAYRIEGLYRKAGTPTPMPDSLFSPELIRGVVTFAVHPPRPNPASGSIEFLLDLPQESRVLLSLFDVSGRRVRQVGPATLAAGTRRALVWDGRDEDGDDTPGGVYFYKLAAGDREVAGSVVRLR